MSRNSTRDRRLSGNASRNASMTASMAWFFITAVTSWRQTGHGLESRLLSSHCDKQLEQKLWKHGMTAMHLWITPMHIGQVTCCPSWICLESASFGVVSTSVMFRKINPIMLSFPTLEAGRTTISSPDFRRLELPLPTISPFTVVPFEEQSRSTHSYVTDVASEEAHSLLAAISKWCTETRGSSKRTLHAPCRPTVNTDGAAS
mmetsp:Transcript_26010/g.60115  ORF Transcript_26010/g.60115 Transcript_26010/m.60115 type:complete len:203 (-) Transcript_26010:340-948(-)